jgi:MFS superfamily sulfate permease-like transporter
MTPGFKAMGTPVINHEIARALGPQIPGAIIVLLIEHIAIAKCMSHLSRVATKILSTYPTPAQPLVA